MSYSSWSSLILCLNLCSRASFFIRKPAVLKIFSSVSSASHGRCIISWTTSLVLICVPSKKRCLISSMLDGYDIKTTLIYTNVAYRKEIVEKKFVNIIIYINYYIAIFMLSFLLKHIKFLLYIYRQQILTLQSVICYKMNFYFITKKDMTDCQKCWSDSRGRRLCYACSEKRSNVCSVINQNKKKLVKLCSWKSKYDSVWISKFRLYTSNIEKWLYILEWYS